MSKEIHTNYQIKSVIWKHVSDSAVPHLLSFTLSKRLHISTSHLHYNKLLHAVADPGLSLASRDSWQNCHLLNRVIVASSQKYIICRPFYSRAQAECSVTSKAAWVSYRVIFPSLLFSLSGQIHTKLHKNGRPGEYPGFVLSKCEQLRKKANAQTQLLLQNPAVQPPLHSHN